MAEPEKKTDAPDPSDSPSHAASKEVGQPAAEENASEQLTDSNAQVAGEPSSDRDPRNRNNYELLGELEFPCSRLDSRIRRR